MRGSYYPPGSFDNWSVETLQILANWLNNKPLPIFRKFISHIDPLRAIAFQRLIPMGLIGCIRSRIIEDVETQFRAMKVKERILNSHK